MDDDLNVVQDSNPFVCCQVFQCDEFRALGLLGHVGVVRVGCVRWVGRVRVCGARVGVWGAGGCPV